MTEQATASYAVSEWHHTDDIYRKLNELIKQPIRPVRREVMQTYLDYFETQCIRSKALIDEAKQYNPGGVQHNLAFNYPFPIAIAKAEGASHAQRATASATTTPQARVLSRGRRSVTG